MGLHKRHTTGRALIGAAARNHLAMHKRDSHGDQPRMHVPEGFDDKATNDGSNGDNAVSVVYVTLPQTFAGAAVYSTMGVTPTADAGPADATADASYSLAMASYSSAMSEWNAAKGATASATSLAVVTPKASSEAQTTLAKSVQGATSNAAPTYMVGTPIQATHAAAATSTSTSQTEQSGSEMSGGAKAGLAFGVILAIALAAGLVFFCWRRKRTTKQQDEMLNEKHGSFADAGARRVEAGGEHESAMVAGGAGRRDSSMTEKVPTSLRSSRTTSTAPRLSLRPVTQFLPNLGDNNKGTGNGSGNNLDVAGAEKRRSGWERTPPGAQQNPFDDATAVPTPRSNSPPQNPFDEPEGKRSNDSQDAARAAGIAAGAAVMAANKKHSPKSSWEGDESATPKSSRFGTAAAVPVAAAAAGSPRGPPPPRGPNNVHRVQLDFKPTMEDELELVSGQLVRMLHEYDDGWALCIKMDRSQQGVAPRTCLSKMPVKPRPQGPPPQGSRPGTSQGPRPGPGPNAQPHHPGPNGPPTPQEPIVPRPLTASQGSRSPSPTESNGEASTSTGGGPAKIGRKPVPGQAM